MIFLCWLIVPLGSAIAWFTWPATPNLNQPTWPTPPARPAEPDLCPIHATGCPAPTDCVVLHQTACDVLGLPLLDTGGAA